MIISRTPLRIPFFSGSTDLPTFYEKEMGAAISCTINKYVYVSVHRHTESYTIVNRSKIDNWHELNQTDPIATQVLKHYGGHCAGLSINTWSDINHRGTGLGSSSAYTVGLIHCLYKLIYGKNPLPKALAERACDIEISHCKFPIGKQDQYAAAYGGLNMFYFHPEGNVSITNLEIPYVLKHNFHLLNSGIERDSSKTIIKELNIDKMREGRSYAYEMFDKLTKPKQYDSIGTLLNNSWKTKKEANKNASTDTIDFLFEQLLSSQNPNYGFDPIGGKILGAGGGGFMLFYVPDMQNHLFFNKVNELKKNFNLSSMYFEFVDKGSEIIYSDK